MIDRTSATPRDGGDWMALLTGHVAGNLPEIDLQSIAEGDILIVSTQNTRYAFRWGKQGRAELATSRGELRPSGEVRVDGCGFGQSSSLKLGVLFCGGNMEYASRGGKMVHRTTLIRTIELLRRSTLISK